MESIANSDFCVMVSDGDSRGVLLGFFNAAVKSLAVSMIMLVAVSVGVMSYWGNKETDFRMQT